MWCLLTLRCLREVEMICTNTFVMLIHYSSQCLTKLWILCQIKYSPSLLSTSNYYLNALIGVKLFTNHLWWNHITNRRNVRMHLTLLGLWFPYFGLRCFSSANTRNTFQIRLLLILKNRGTRNWYQLFWKQLWEDFVNWLRATLILRVPKNATP